jgi:hypothetical protein
MGTALSRRRFLKSAGVGLAVGAAGSVGGSALAQESAATAPVTPADALRLLFAGNRRWVTGRLTHPHLT